MQFYSGPLMHLLSGLDTKACREGFSVLYKRASRLFTDLAHAGPQRLPTRAAPSLMRALRVARGSPPWTPWTILCRLDRHHPFLQPVFKSTAQPAATLTPTLSAA